MPRNSKHLQPLKTMVLGVLWILGSCWFWYSITGNPLEEFSLIRRGHTAPGSIVDSWEEDDGQRAVYSYRLPDGRAFTNGGAFPGRLKEDLLHLQRPYPVEVEYLPENPAVSRIKGDGCGSVTEWLWRKIGIGTLLLVMLAGVGVEVLLEGLRELRGLPVAKPKD